MNEAQPYDVVIVGSGAAGLTAAFTLANRCRAIVLVAASLVTASCAHPEAGSRGSEALDGLLGFTKPELCEPSRPHQEFLAAMIAGDANDGFRAGRLRVPSSVRRLFGTITVTEHDQWWTIEVPVSGTFFGLPLTRISHALPFGGDPGDVIYTFAAPIAQVESVLRAAGFPVKAHERVSLGTPNGYDFIIDLLSDPKNAERTLFGCGGQ